MRPFAYDIEKVVVSIPSAISIPQGQNGSLLDGEAGWRRENKFFLGLLLMMADPPVSRPQRVECDDD